MPTEADWKRLVEEQKKSEAPSRVQYDSLLQQAVVASDLLTSHPAWDVYLQRLQAELEQAEQSLKTLYENIHQVYTEQDIRKGQLWIAMYVERVAMLKHCMSLPKEILSHAHDTLDNARQ